MSGQAAERPFLLDISRLVWRVWRGKLPTGIDRVCQAYVEHFGSRSQAVVQRRGFHFILSPDVSDRLFHVLTSTGPNTRLELLKIASTAWLGAPRPRPHSGAIYLNVGHTGLDENSLPSWITRHRLRAVFLIHDLIPLTHPQYCREGEAGKHARRMICVLDSAAGVIGNSQATLDDLARFATKQGKPMPKSIAALIGSADLPSGIPAKHLKKRHFVTVGTIEGRKNHQLLLDVWDRLHSDRGEDAPALIIIGQRGWQAESVFQRLDDLGALGAHVFELGACDDDELAAWLAGAEGLLMPSFVEGFGMPVIEALELGTPVIAADLPVYRELAGDVPTYLDPNDPDGWRRTIEDFSGRGSEREKQVVALAQFRAPSWEDHFRKVETWFDTL